MPRHAKVWASSFFVLLASSCSSTGTDPGGGSTLLRQRPEPAGPNCASGGIALLIGVDANGDGTLGDDEVQSTGYVCNGTSPDVGLPDTSADTTIEETGLVDSTADADTTLGDTGTDTTLGDTGTDTTLGDTGTDSPADTACGSVLAGSFTIHNAVDVATLSAFCRITGDLDIDAPGLTDITLPSITSIGGTIQPTGSGGPDLVTLALPSLASVGGIDLLNSSLLGSFRTLRLPALTRIVGDLSILSPALSQLDLPALTTISGTTRLTLPPNPINLPLLTAMGDFTLASGVPTLTLPSLATAGNLTLSFGGSTSLSLVHLGAAKDIVLSGTSSIDLSKLASATNLQITSAPALTSLNLPALTTVKSVSFDNTQAVVHFPALTSAQTFTVGRNGEIPSLDVPLLTDLPGGLSLHGEVASKAVISFGALKTTSAITLTESSKSTAMAGAAFASFSFPALLSVSGALSIDCGYAGSTLEVNPMVLWSLPALASAGSIKYACASTFDLPALTLVGNVTVSSPLGSVSPPPSVHLDALLNAGNITLTGTGSLSFAALQTSGFFAVSGSRAGSTISAPNLLTVGSSAGYDLTLEAPIAASFPKLQTVKGDLVLTQVTSFSAPVLATIGARALVSRTQLVTLNLPALKSVNAGGPGGALFGRIPSGDSFDIGDGLFSSCYADNGKLTGVRMPLLVGPTSAPVVVRFSSSPSLFDGCVKAVQAQSGISVNTACYGSQPYPVGACP